MTNSIFDSNPPSGAVSITPADGADLAREVSHIYVGTAGTLKVDLADGTTVEFQNLAAGVWHEMKVKKVYATVASGTIAADILGGYVE